MIRRISLFAFMLVAAAGCGGGGNHGTLPAATQPGQQQTQSGATANAQLSITIPAAVGTQATRRSQYVSPGTNSLSFAPATGAAVVVALTPATPGCTTNAGSLTCTVNVPLPIGANQTFTVATFGSTDGSGTPLSTTTTTQTIVAGQPNPISLSLGGVPATVTLGVPTSAVPSVAATSIPVSVTVKDASGNTIVGNVPFSNASGAATPISLTDTDASNGTTVSPASLTAPGSATVTYDNYFQTTTAALKASIGSTTAATATVTFAGKPIVFAYTYGAYGGSGDPVTFGTNTGIESRAQHRGAAGRRRTQSVSPSTGVQKLGNLLPTGLSAGPYQLGTNTSSSASSFVDLNDAIYDIPNGGPTSTTSAGLATAANGHAIISAINGTQSGIYDAGTTPAWPGSALVTGAFGPLALAPGGKFYVAISGGFEQINPATGAVIGAPVTVPGSFTATVPNAIAAGPDGAVYIEAFDTAESNDNVLAFTPTTAGFTFSHSFSTANTHLSGDAIYGLTVDSSNNVYISADNCGCIDIVPSTSQGEVVPARVISDRQNIFDGANVLVDRMGNIIWATWETVSIYAPNSGSVPPGSTTATTPWTPATDTTAVQTLTDTTNTYNDAFILISFGPGT